VIELDMFGQALDFYHTGQVTHSEAGFGSDLDGLLFNEFVSACLERRTPKVTGEDGLAAAKVALAGYRSVEAGEPVTV
jgi:predicted dehydrogenase